MQDPDRSHSRGAARGKKPAKRRSQVEKDNARVPRDWANDPAWLRDLLRRTWEAIGDDVDIALRIGEADGITHREFDLLMGQVRYVIGVEETWNRSRASTRGES